MKTKVALIVAAASVAIFCGAWALKVRNERKRIAFEKLPSAEQGLVLLETEGCTSCHQPASEFRAPILKGLVGRSRALVGGSTVIIDQDYLKRSLMSPGAEVVAGYQNNMPSYKDRLTAEQVQALVDAMK